MNRVKVILIQPITIFSKKFDYGNTPLYHLLTMASYLDLLRKKDSLKIDIEIINLLDEKIKRSMNIEELNEYIKDLISFFSRYNDGSNLIFGISFFSTNYYLSGILLGKILRFLYPKSIICCGGYHVNFFPNDFIFPNYKFGFKINQKIFDYIFLGEADKEFGNLIKSLIYNNKINSRFDQPTFIINCGKIEDLDSLPPVDFSLMNYKHQYIFFIPLLFSRGCPFNCNFCGDFRNNDPNFKKKKWRMHSPNYAINELISTTKFFDSLNYKYQILIFDPLFTYPQWRKKFYERLIQINFKEELWAEIRIDQFSIKQELDLVKKLNFSIAFGIESGSKKILTIMNKTKYPELYLKRTIEVIEALSNTNIYIITNFIFGHPGENLDTIMESCKFIDNLLYKKNNIIPSFAKYMLTPGSEVYNNMSNYYKTYGTEFKYPYYWMIPKCYFLTSSAVNPSSSLTYKDIFKITSPYITDKLKTQIKNLLSFDNRNFIYQRYLSNTIFKELKHWKTIFSDLYIDIEDSNNLKEETISFWNFLSEI